MSTDWRGRDKKKGKKTLIWISDELRERLDAAAKANYRDMTAEVNKRLNDSFENQSIDEHGVIVQHIPAARK